MKYTPAEVQALWRDKGAAYRDPVTGAFGYPVVDRDDLATAHAAADPADEKLQRYLDRREKFLDQEDARAKDSNGDDTTKDSDGTDGQRPAKAKKKRKPTKRPQPGKTTSDNQQDGSSSGGNPNATGVADGSGSLSSTLPITLRASGSPLVLETLASKYSLDYHVHDALGSYVERMAPNACRDATIDGCVYLLNHQGMPLARCPATMTITDGPDALRCRAVLSDTQTGRDVYEACRRGDLTQASIGFLCGEDEWNSNYTQRLIKKIDRLADISIVNQPANPGTSVTVAARSAGDDADRRRGQEWARMELRRVRSRA